nr:EOG090X0FJX [Lepidurus arcticus]
MGPHEAVPTMPVTLATRSPKSSAQRSLQIAPRRKSQVFVRACKLTKAPKDVFEHSKERFLLVQGIIIVVFRSPYRTKELTIVFHQLFWAGFQLLSERARIDFTSPSATAADAARIHLHQSVFAGSPINVYFAQPIILKSATAQQAYLQLPPPVRQFLISPPASPPVDWAPGPESEPIINYDLLAALAKLGPGEAHELHPSSESHPSIVVHVCGEEVDDSLTGGGGKIAPTKCPQRK